MSEVYATPVEAAAPVSNQSAVSWAAIFAGGVAAAAIAIILTILGAGLGLASVSPWAGQGVSAVGFTIMAAVWLIIVQWVASFFGGFIAGRLRTKWVAVHTDEVGFRDTAHGFLAWAVALLITVGALAMAGSNAVRLGSDAASKAADTKIAQTYYLSELLRPAASGSGGTAAGLSLPGMTPQQIRDDASAVLTQSAVTGNAPQADKDYLATLVMAATGMDQASAQARVNDVLTHEQADITKARQVANAARKSAAVAAIYTFFSALIGAFIAAVAGALGGRIRDWY